MPLHMKKTVMQGQEMRVKATCDECGVEKTVRKTWASKKYKENGPPYICRSCSSSKNIQIALKAKGSSTGVIDLFLDICHDILELDFWDKDPRYIASVTGHADSFWLVQEAQQFCYQFKTGLENIPADVLNLATQIEEGFGELYASECSLETEMKARALLEFESI
jgi:transcription elongation factor Elf1